MNTNKKRIFLDNRTISVTQVHMVETCVAHCARTHTNAFWIIQLGEHNTECGFHVLLHIQHPGEMFGRDRVCLRRQHTIFVKIEECLCVTGLAYGSDLHVLSGYSQHDLTNLMVYFRFIGIKLC